MAGSPPNFDKMDSRSACIQDVLKVKVKVKGHVIRALSWIRGMSYSVIDGLVEFFLQTKTATMSTVQRRGCSMPDTAKSRRPIVVLVRGTTSVPLSADRNWQKAVGARWWSAWQAAVEFEPHQLCLVGV